MEAEQIHEENGQKTFVLVFGKGDEVVSGITGFAKENGTGAVSLTAIGVFSDATLGYFDVEKKEYEEIPVWEQVEVLSMVGDIAEHEGKPKLRPTRCSVGAAARRAEGTSWRPRLPDAGGGRHRVPGAPEEEDNGRGDGVDPDRREGPMRRAHEHDPATARGGAPGGRSSTEGMA